MNIWRIEPAMPEHVAPIAANMREADKREVWASHRHMPEEALRSSLRFSDRAWTCFIHDVPAIMWGVGRIGCIFSDTGMPWLLGTNAVYEVRRDFLIQSRAYMDRLQEGFARLENYVHAENKTSILWLIWCGFTIDQKTPVVLNGEDFYRFWRDKDV